MQFAICNHSIRKVTPAGIISTIAGRGPNYGFSGDNGPANAALLANPGKIAVDSQGNFYFIDSGASRVRKVSTDGVITTIAGTGTAGFSGDGGPATSASISSIDIAVDATGNVFLAEVQFVPFTSLRIRKITPGGTISTVAGDGNFGSFGGDNGPATATSIFPSYLAVDSSGNVLFRDETSGRIRMVTPAGVISTYVTPAVLQTLGQGPIAIDAAGNLYVSDFNNYRIRKMTPGGTVTTVAGNGIPGYSGDGGMATAASLYPQVFWADAAGNLYIGTTDITLYTTGPRIRKVNTSGVISTVAGDGYRGYSGDGGPATAARVKYPAALAADSSGNFFIVDVHSNAIRKVDSAGVISTVAGNGSGSFSGDGGPASSATLDEPSGVAVDADGNIFIADSGNGRIRKIDAMGIISTIAGDGAGGEYGAFAGDEGPAVSASLAEPGAVVVDSSGNIFIADTQNNRVRKVNTAGVIATVAGNGSREFGNFAGDGGPAAQANLYAPTGIAIDSAGSLFIGAGDSLRKVTSGGILSTIDTEGTVRAVTIDAADNLFFTRSNHTVVQRTSDGSISIIAGNGMSGFTGDGGPATSAQLNAPAGLGIDAGNLYIADTDNHRVRVVILSSAKKRFGQLISD